MSLLEKLQEAYDAAKENYVNNGRTDYDAGRLDGLRQALEIIADENKVIN